MAKVKAPLFSLGASGSIAKTLVYFPWKGLNAVREHVVPTNPDTQPQRDQRAHMTAAVKEYHAMAYPEKDITAWARLAGAEGLIMTGFNRMVKEFIDEAVDENAWESIHSLVTSIVTSTGFRVVVMKVSAGNAPTLRYGTRKTYFPTFVAMEDQTANIWQIDLSTLTPNTLYYLTIDVGTRGTDWGRVGIHMQRTSAA